VLLSAGDIDREKRGAYHVEDLEKFRREGYLYKLAMINARVNSHDEIGIIVSRQSIKLKEQRGKLYLYDVMGIECKAFSVLEGDTYQIYPEYGKELNLFLKER